MNNNPTFKHDYKTAFGIIDINGAQNYMKALNAVSKHIVEKMLIKDDVFYVNARELEEVIANTFLELSAMVHKEVEEMGKDDIFKGDNLWDAMVNITKQHAKDTYGIDLDKKTDSKTNL